MIQGLTGSLDNLGGSLLSSIGGNLGFLASLRSMFMESGIMIKVVGFMIVFFIINRVRAMVTGDWIKEQESLGRKGTQVNTSSNNRRF